MRDKILSALNRTGVYHLDDDSEALCLDAVMEVVREEMESILTWLNHSPDVDFGDFDDKSLYLDMRPDGQDPRTRNNPITIKELLNLYLESLTARKGA